MSKYVLCDNDDCALIGPNRPTPDAAIAAWNALAHNLRVHTAALCWQQAIAATNGVHAAEQALLAALKEPAP